MRLAKKIDDPSGLIDAARIIGSQLDFVDLEDEPATSVALQLTLNACAIWIVRYVQKLGGTREHVLSIAGKAWDAVVAGDRKHGN